MSTCIKAVFGFGVVLKYGEAPWLEDEFEEFDHDFLEWVSQQMSQLPSGEMFDASIEERKQFASTLPVTFIQAINSDEYYLLLTKFHWLLKKPKAMKVNLDLDEFDTELIKAKSFCKKMGDIFEYSPQWLLGLMFD